ncbi:ABC transporter permease family protein [Corynebacterium epidermidicanis]|uniref:hypothetical protein n=1 Tax=Corynebacterium epidermidicanis TaxID=1050174 RepID=UPI00130D611D|nr:hypothetical protein [Corynebacterium epidermidicanis]
MTIFLLALPTLIVTSFFSMMHTAFVIEEYPENYYSYALSSTPPRPDFTPAYRGQGEVVANGETVVQYFTALTEDAPPEGTVIIPRDVARALAVAPGDSVTVNGKELTVHDLRYPSNLVGNYADAKDMGPANSHWWATSQPVGPQEFRLSGIYIEEAQKPPPPLWKFVTTFFGDPIGATMALSFFGLILIFTAALTTPLFAIAHRRLRHVSEQLTYIGARTSYITGILLWEGALLGFIGATLGLVLAWPLTEAGMRFIVGEPATFSWQFGLMLAAVTLLSTLLAAQLPLRLSKRAHTRFTAIQLFSGPILVLAGLLLLFEQNIGILLCLPVISLGAFLLGPAIVSILRVMSAKFPPILRLSARDAYRNAGRTSAAIGAITVATLSIGTLATALPYVGFGDKALSTGVIAKANVAVSSPTNFSEVLDSLSGDFGKRVDIYDTNEHDGYSGQTAWYDLGLTSYHIVAEPEIVDYFTVDPSTREAIKQRLRQGETVSTAEMGLEKPGKLSSVPAAELPTGYIASLYPKAPGPLQQLKLHRMSQTSGMEIGAADQSRSVALVSFLMAALGLLFILGVLFLVVALAQLEQRSDQQKLWAIGASRATLRWLSFAQAGMIAVPSIVIGTSLAAFVGNFFFDFLSQPWIDF